MPSRVEQFEALVAAQPANELFRFSLGQALLAERRAADALPHFESCVRQKPDWMMARIHAARTLLELGRRAEAKPLLEAALALAVAQGHEDPERDVRALLADL